MSFTSFHITVRWPVDSIENNNFKSSTWFFNRERLNGITVYAQVFSYFKAKIFPDKNANSSSLTTFSFLMEELVT